MNKTKTIYGPYEMVNIFGEDIYVRSTTGHRSFVAIMMYVCNQPGIIYNEVEWKKYMDKEYYSHGTIIDDPIMFEKLKTLL